jgi:hypothetical protein
VKVNHSKELPFAFCPLPFAFCYSILVEVKTCVDKVEKPYQNGKAYAAIVLRFLADIKENIQIIQWVNQNSGYNRSSLFYEGFTLKESKIIWRFKI